MIQLFDTHTHFDLVDFDHDRDQLVNMAKQNGVEHLLLIGIAQPHFAKMLAVHDNLNQLNKTIKIHIAPGLHPFYIQQHELQHLNDLEHILKTRHCAAIGEIGLDTFLPQHKQTAIIQQQQSFFAAQLELATSYHKPIALHIRKAHAQVLAMLKQHRFKNAGIAHAFSGGIEEAKAFIQLGFKIGITGQITNLNAKKLRQVVEKIGFEHLVIETDCPDMTPLCCQNSTTQRTRNVPANLVYVLNELATIFAQPKEKISQKLWENSFQVLDI